MQDLAWTHPVSEITEKGLSVDRTATPAEREALRARLDILGLDRLQVRYRIRPRGGGSYHLEGRMEAELTQACVLSLEPVLDRLAADLDVEFRPGIEAPGESDDLGDPFAAGEVEPIANGLLDVGRVVFEELASSLNPYPRAEGVNFDWKDPTDAGEGATNPFARLAALKDKKT